MQDDGVRENCSLISTVVSPHVVHTICHRWFASLHFAGLTTFFLILVKAMLTSI